MKKQWRLSEKKLLFNLVAQKGKNWREFSKVFNVTPNAVYKCYSSTNWGNVFKDEFPVGQKGNSKNVAKNVSVAENGIETTKTKILDRHEIRKQNELLNKIAKDEIIIDKILGAIEATPKIEPAEIKYPGNFSEITRPQEAVLCLSDLHIGLSVKPDEVGNLGNYNIDVFTQRMSNLVESVTKITFHHRKCYKLNTLNIFGLGDFVHGANNAGMWGFVHTEQTVMDQVFLAVREIEKAILQFNQVYEKTNFYGVYGNHGRVDKPGMEKPYVNWDYLIYKILESKLEKQKNIKFNIPKAPFVIADVLGNKFLLTHGSYIKSWGGLPFYGMVRTESKYRTMIERNKNFNSLLKEYENNKENLKNPENILSFALQYSKTFRYLVLGHFHQMAELETNSDGKIILNSSFAGGDDYSINSLFSASTASQKFFGVHVEGKSFSYDIELDREIEKKGNKK